MLLVAAKRDLNVVRLDLCPRRCRERDRDSVVGDGAFSAADSE
jgi:hypothetical protein